MDIWKVLMLVAAGLFAGGAASFAWSRVPIWQRMEGSQFVRDFAQTLDRTDKVQPALLVVAIISAAGYALSTDGLARLLALLGAAGFVVTLVASFALLVPLQRTIIASAAERPDVAEMRARWDRGNLARSVLAVVSCVVVAMAAAV